MILSSLTKCYEMLASQGKIPRQGWSPAKISFALNLDRAGKLISVSYLCRETETGKRKIMIPREMNLPAPVIRSSGIQSNFLWDHSAYLLGVDDKGKPERARKCFEACKEKHRLVLAQAKGEAAQALSAFFETWDPQQASETPELQEYWGELISGVNITFRVEGTFVSEDASVCSAWQNCVEANGEEEKRCLVTGRYGKTARLHPLIKGIAGAQSSGASLVSFNAASYWSYGKEQGKNAPVSEYAAFAYTSALNYMLREERYHQRLGDTTLVYWVLDEEPSYMDLLAAVFGNEREELTQGNLSSVMAALAKGNRVQYNGAEIQPEKPFYILGLSPNAARLSVRFFSQNTFGAVMSNLERHYQDIEIVHGPEKKKYLSPWNLLMETINQKAREKKPNPRLAGDLLRAVLLGQPYPETLYRCILLRIRAGDKVNYGRAAVIKGYLLRNGKNVDKEVLKVELNENSNYTPYVLGRLFSVLEGLQQSANPGINATIRDRYFSSACATPAVIFPRLINLAQNHLRKLEGGLQGYYEKQLTELESRIAETLPVRLNLQEQGAFQLGYYHQTQKRYEKKEKRSEEN